MDCRKILDELEFSPRYCPEDSLDEIIKNINFDTYDFSDDIYYNIKVFKEVVK